MAVIKAQDEAMLTEILARFEEQRKLRLEERVDEPLPEEIKRLKVADPVPPVELDPLTERAERSLTDHLTKANFRLPYDQPLSHDELMLQVTNVNALGPQPLANWRFFMVKAAERVLDV